MGKLSLQIRQQKFHNWVYLTSFSLTYLVGLYTITPMIESQRRLIRKVNEAGAKPWALHKLPEPKIIEDLPKILFWMYGHDGDPEARIEDYLQKDRLNKPGKLITFTQRAVEAAQYFGLGLRAEGIPGPLVIMLFPHETTNLKRWVEAPGAHHNLPGTRIFLTDQRINRCDTFITEYTRIMNDNPFEPNKSRNIQAFQYADGKKAPVLPPEKQTRQTVMEMFNITSEYQEKMLQLFK